MKTTSLSEDPALVLCELEKVPSPRRPRGSDFLSEGHPRRERLETVSLEARCSLCLAEGERAEKKEEVIRLFLCSVVENKSHISPGGRYSSSSGDVQRVHEILAPVDQGALCFEHRIERDFTEATRALLSGSFSQLTCPTHPNLPLNQFCPECDNIVCSSCCNHRDSATFFSLDEMTAIIKHDFKTRIPRMQQQTLEAEAAIALYSASDVAYQRAHDLQEGFISAFFTKVIEENPSDQQQLEKVLQQLRDALTKLRTDHALSLRNISVAMRKAKKEFDDLVQMGEHLMMVNDCSTVLKAMRLVNHDLDELCVISSLFHLSPEDAKIYTNKSSLPKNLRGNLRVSALSNSKPECLINAVNSLQQKEVFEIFGFQSLHRLFELLVPRGKNVSLSDHSVSDV